MVASSDQSYLCRVTPALLRATVAALLALAAGVSATAIDAPSEVDATVSVESVRSERCTVEATVRNAGVRPLRNVRLLVECVYHWPDEHHPGDVSPGRAWTHVVPGPIAPGATETVISAPPDGPPSSPGTFEARVRVLGFTEAGAGASGAPGEGVAP